MTPPTEPLRIVLASRGSRLALKQTEIVASLLQGDRPDLEVEVLTVKTRGDIDRRPFSEITGKGLFTSEVERAVVEGRADAAVHSAKDLTAQLAEGCAIVCVPKRAQASDVVVGGEGATGEERIASLARGARVGTSSIRRRALLAEARPDLEAVELRGNLDTRLRKLADGEVDAAILAAAGISRLEVDPGSSPLEEDWWVPAPAQGALAVEALADRDDLRALFAPVSHAPSEAEIACERAFSERLEGGCAVPLGCRALERLGTLVVTGYLGSPDGSFALRDRISGPASEARNLGKELADAIRAGGGDEILAGIDRHATVEPP